MLRKVRSLVVGTAAAALAVAGITALAGGTALAAGGGGPTPPWEASISPAPNGFITFYNAQGQVVTGGSLTASGLGAYAVASTTDPSPTHTKATLFIYTPVNGVNPGAWSGTQVGDSTVYPDTSAPAPISGQTNPTETNVNGTTDEPVETQIEEFPNTDTSSDGYANLYDVRLQVSGGTGGTEAYWDTVISVNTTAGTWSVDYPDWTQNTTTTLTASPASPQTAPASPITLTANVTGGEAGFVSFWTGYGTSSVAQVGTTQKVTTTSGTASVTTTPPTGTTDYTAVFTPTPGSGSADVGSESSPLAYTVGTPLDTTSTTLSETGGGGAAGTPVNFTATVADTTTPSATPAGTVSFYDNGSSTPLGSATLTGGTATFSYTYSAAGSHSVVATYTPTASSQWAGSTSQPVTFSETAPTNPLATNVATVEGTIPAGTLAVYTPYTATNPLKLGTLALNGAGTAYSASTPLDSSSSDVPTAGAIPDTTFNGITVVDTQSGNLPWTVTAQASALSDGGSNPGSSISGEDVGLTNLTAVAVPGNALTASDLSFTNAPAASPPVGPTDTGDQGLGGGSPHTIVTDSTEAIGTIGINATVTLTAPTSTEAGTFIGTITFTIAS